jgi:hypothetical protein
VFNDVVRGFVEEHGDEGTLTDFNERWRLNKEEEEVESLWDLRDWGINGWTVGIGVTSVALVVPYVVQLLGGLKRQANSGSRSE